MPHKFHLYLIIYYFKVCTIRLRNIKLLTSLCLALMFQDSRSKYWPLSRTQWRKDLGTLEVRSLHRVGYINRNIMFCLPLLSALENHTATTKILKKLVLRWNILKIFFFANFICKLFLLWTLQLYNRTIHSWLFNHIFWCYTLNFTIAFISFNSI